MHLLLALMLLATTPPPAHPVEQVRQAEIAFAKAFADRDKAKFFSFVAHDATFLSGLTTLRGREQVIERWSRYFATPEAPFSWAPDRVSVSADGTLGLSTGPVYDPKGYHVGDYISTWRKQADGTWKIVFDSTGPGPAPLPEHAVPFEEGFLPADDGLKLHYRKIGRGPITIIAPLDYLLHDSLKQFADFATVITYDPRNRAKSERAKDLSTSTIQQDVRDLEAVRRHFKAERFVPIGFSYLGLMVALYALDHPDHVVRVVQLGPAFPGMRGEMPPLDQIGTAADRKRLEELRAAGARETSPREFCEAYWSVFRFLFLGDPKHASRFDLSFCALENEWPLHVDAHFGALLGSAANLGLTDEKLQTLKTPVLTIHGTSDRVAPYAGGVRWART
ncbi:MAG TPA: alpha/beta fold hydrolase, partial [Thermoanaerobaculia bacterium]|nr:alpha/beta fold hydrolase [Thermoanaerobaculia bacterium]